MKALDTNVVVRFLVNDDARQGGRAKRFYELQARGAEALRRSREVLSGLWDGLTIDPESFA